MSLPDPKDIRADFWTIMQAMNKADRELTVSEQKGIGEKMVPIYNYLSAQVEGRSGINVIHAQSAHVAKIQQELSAERATLKEHQAFVARNFESAEKYFKTIQLAGYAVFFAIWGFAHAWVPQIAQAVAALLMVLSALVFVAWELFKTSILATILSKSAGLASGGVEQFIRRRSSQFASTERAINFFAHARVYAWWLCVVPAVAALCVLVSYIVVFLICG
jgi:hypothetical protein